MYTYFKGGVRNFLVDIFGRNAFLACFFSKFCLRRRNFGQNRDFLVLWESSENQFGRPKKRSIKFRKIFEIFLVDIFGRNAFLACFFFKILPAAKKFWPKQGFFSALGELGNFLSLEKILDPPLVSFIFLSISLPTFRSLIFSVVLPN